MLILNSLSILYSFKCYGVGLQRQRAPGQSIPDHRPDNSSSYSRASVTLDSLSPSGTTKRVQHREVSGHSLHQTTPPPRALDWVAISFSRGSSQPRDQTQVWSNTKSTVNLSKSSNLLYEHSIQPHDLRASPPLPTGLFIERSSQRNSRAQHLLPSHPTVFILCLLQSSLFCPFLYLDDLLDYYTLSSQHTFPNLAPSFRTLPIQFTLLPD